MVISSYRFSKGEVHLTAQQVAHVGGGRRVTDEPVDLMQLLHHEVVVDDGHMLLVIIAHLQEALHAARRMLWAHA